MLIPTIIMGVIAVALLVIAYLRGGGEHILGLKSAGNLLLQIIPLLIFAFIIAGMIQVIVPQEMISKWVGTESGLRGIWASIGTMVAFMTAWSLLAVTRLPLEIGLMGWQFSLIRLACTFFFPPIAGLIANKLFSGVTPAV
jgi:uncharacterized membrane protein YraQ (UPF0718 family)